jgi:hypothetical protein
MRELVDKHRTKVDWHIRRIYRSRNLLIHAGQKLPYLSSLVENLHYYFHCVFDGIQDICSRRSGQTTLDAVLLALRLEVQEHYASLEQRRSENVTESNLIELLGGPVLATE